MAVKRKKKLVAIMFTELAGYNKLASDDEKLALQLLNEHDRIIDKIVDNFSGRIIKHMNEKIFAEFTSATEAIQCGISIQETLRKANEQNPETFQMLVKIGIHMGEVYEKDGDLFGDGVNMAARIEPIAASGEILTSQAVYNSIRSEKDIFTRDLGRIFLKNIKDPERVFKVYVNEFDYNNETTNSLIKSLVERDIQLADRKVDKGKVQSVAVLYLNNLGSSDDEFFCYGLTEDLTIDLGKAGKIRVPGIADVMKHKNLFNDIPKLIEVLNVDHIVEGSIMRIGEMFRLSLQLIDSKNKPIWTEIWEGNTHNLQKIRSQVAAKVLESFGLEIPDSFQKLLKKERKVSAEAYELFLKGRYLNQSAKSNMDIEITQSLFKEAIKLDPNFIEVRYHYASVLLQDNKFEKAVTVLDEAMIVAKKEKDFSAIAGLHNVYGLIYKKWGKYDQAIDSFEDALAERAKENNLQEEAKILNNLGQSYANIGESEKSLEYLNRSLTIKRELDDKKLIASSVANMSFPYKRGGNYSKAIELCKESIELFDELKMKRNFAIMKMNLANNLVYIGHYEEAMKHYKESLQIVNDLNDYGSAGIIYRHQGIIYLNQENWKQAQQSFIKALKFHHKAEHRPAVEATTLFLGQAYLYADKMEESEKYIQRAVKLATRRKMSFYDASSRAICFLYQAKNDELAKDEFFAFAKELVSHNNQGRKTRELWYVSQIFLLIGQKDKALEFQLKAQQALKRVANKIEDTKIREDYLHLPLIHRKMFEDLTTETSSVQKQQEVKEVRKSKEEPQKIFAFCPSCGTPNKNKFKFCPSCGNSLVND